MKSHSSDRPVGPTHRLSEKQPKSPLSIALGQRAYLTAKAVALWTVNTLAKAQEIRNRQRQDAGNS